jgi:hypothetical protein
MARTDEDRDDARQEEHDPVRRTLVFSGGLAAGAALVGTAAAQTV